MFSLCSSDKSTSRLWTGMTLNRPRLSLCWRLYGHAWPIVSLLNLYLLCSPDKDTDYICTVTVKKTLPFLLLFVLFVRLQNKAGTDCKRNQAWSAPFPSVAFHFLHLCTVEHYLNSMKGYITVLTIVYSRSSHWKLLWDVFIPLEVNLQVAIYKHTEPGCTLRL
jgi:hypothetical protein